MEDLKVRLGVTVSGLLFSCLYVFVGIFFFGCFIVFVIFVGLEIVFET